MTGPRPAAAPLELWGGVECTINRVGDVWRDQVALSGHDRRLDDVDRFAALGIRALRHGVLWERVAPGGLAAADWRWPDASLARIRALGLRPIVGLVHHGSGPRSTSLLDAAGFPAGLAAYARAVAERYPWVEDWTPVNEPLTTARFSGLYGLWYPHERGDLPFARAFLTQCRAIVLAMRAIREVIPHARLVQTEDLGRIHATPALAYQAAFENDRRWLTVDLLTGRVGPGHRMHKYFRDAGVPRDEIEWFRAHPCPPDVVGVNHYLSSERFLDPRLRRYPPHTWGGNGRHRYADVEAARVLAEGADGPAALLREAWERYRLPLAVTEVHNGCSREEQCRWLLEVWDAAEALRQDGVDLRAVTAWALLGAYDWDTLLTRERGHYEPGVFDVRDPVPRATAAAALLRTLASGGRPAHPLFSVRGWWHRAERLVYGGPVGASGRRPAHPLPPWRDDVPLRPLLVTGAAGTLGRAIVRLCALRGLPVVALERRELDIADAAAVEDALAGHRPWGVVNAAGYVRVDDAEHDAREAARCLRENRDGPAVLADACARHGAHLVTFSSDLVFGGAPCRPYVESDPPDPLNVYGRSKAEAEARVLAALPSALVIRTSAFFGPWDEWNFVTRGLRALAADGVWEAGEELVSPTYVPDLVHHALDLLIDGDSGIRHLANAGAVTWAQFARMAAALAGADPARVRVVDARPAARRPAWSALGSERGQLLPPLADALERYMGARAMPAIAPPLEPDEVLEA